MASLSDYLKLTVWLDGEFVPAKSIEFRAVTSQPETLEHLAPLTYQLCPACGSVMARETRADTVTYEPPGGDPVHRCVNLSGWWCGHCGEAIFDGEALAQRESVFLSLKAECEA